MVDVNPVSPLTAGDSPAAARAVRFILLPRNPNLSVSEFRDYYEGNHSKIVQGHGEFLQLFPPRERYLRRYLQPLSSNQGAGVPRFDAIHESWFAGQDLIDKSMKIYTDHPKFSQIIRADEERLFDCSFMQFYCIEESPAEDLSQRRAEDECPTLLILTRGASDPNNLRDPNGAVTLRRVRALTPMTKFSNCASDRYFDTLFEFNCPNIATAEAFVATAMGVGGAAAPSGHGDALTIPADSDAYFVDVQVESTIRPII